MKKAKSKNLRLEKLNITKLEHMSSIKGGHEKTGDPGDGIYLVSNALRTGCCPVQPTHNCPAGTTILIF